jgi:CheY-like chemotaxis protein
MSEINNTFQRELQQAEREIDQLRNQLRQAQAESARAHQEARRKIQEFARDVRVPLTSVLGFTDLLSVTHKGNPTELNQIAKAGHQLMHLVTHLEEAGLTENFDATAGPVHGDEPLAVTRTVLHIEDNETNFRLVERILEDRANLTLLWACNGEQGIALASLHRPALILLDLNLPDIHGSELLLRLKNNPVTEQIPVIVISADISPSQIESMLQAGARNYLTKPFEIKRLLCLVDEGLATAAQAGSR